MDRVRGALMASPAFLERNFLYFLFFLVPMLIYPFSIDGRQIDLRKIREIGLYSFGIIILGFLQKNRWLRYFIIWCVINWWLNFFIPRESYIGLTNIFSALILYSGLKYLIGKDIIKANVLLKIICWTVIFQFAWLMMQTFNFDPIFYPVTAGGVEMKGAKMPLVSWSGNPSVLAIFFAMNAFLLLSYSHLWVFLVVIFSALFLLKSATMALGLFVGAIFICFCRKGKKIIPLILLGALLCGSFLWIKKPNLDRLPIWKQLVEKSVSGRPIVGCGINYFAHLNIIDKTQTIWKEAHNDYLQMYLELGIIGLLLFIGFIISKFRSFFRLRYSNLQLYLVAGLVVFLISGLSMFSMHLPQLSFYAIIQLACLDYSYEKAI